jgi:ankyrin repeat protein
MARSTALWIAAIVLAFAAGIGGGVYGPGLWQAARVQSPAPPSGAVAYYDIRDTDDGGIDHFAGVQTRLHRSGPEDQFDYVALEIIVAPDGRVIAATPRDGVKSAYADAVVLALTWKLKPFLRNGQPVYARMANVAVGVNPPERWSDYPVAFPPVRDFKSVVISLKRSGCFGSCPAYKVMVHGDGTIEYEGLGFVVVHGKHRAQVPVAVVRALVEAFRRARFFSLLPNYSASITDSATNIVTISFDGHTAQVIDYVGEKVGMPDVVTDLEETIDRELGVERWTRGNDDTVPSLLAERWNFGADTCAASSLVGGAAAFASANLVRALLEHGAPAVAHCRADERGGTQAALVSAASRQESEMVDILLAAGAGTQRRDVEAAMIAAAGTGNQDITLHLSAILNDDLRFADAQGNTVLMAAADSCAPMLVLNLTVGHRSAVDAVDWDGKTALLHAAMAYGAKMQNPKADCAETVSLLLASGANPNIRDRRLGNTPLIANAFDPAIARYLLKAGANVNAQNKSGKTALMESWNAELTRVLLQAGADPWLVDKQGHSALDGAREVFAGRILGSPVPVLEAWTKTHPKPKT